MTIQDIKNLTIPSYFCCEDVEFYAEEVGISEYYYGATKFVIPISDFEVAKIPFSRDPDYYDINDYCGIELNIYNRAKECGLEKFFPKTYQCGETKDGTPIYIAERVQTLREHDSISFMTSDDSYQKALNSPISIDIDYDWLAIAYEQNMEEDIDRLLQFIEDNDINDLHSENVGFRSSGEVVLIDFSGFNDY